MDWLNNCGDNGGAEIQSKIAPPLTLITKIKSQKANRALLKGSEILFAGDGLLRLVKLDGTVVWEKTGGLTNDVDSVASNGATGLIVRENGATAFDWSTGDILWTKKLELIIGAGAVDALNAYAGNYMIGIKTGKPLKLGVEFTTPLLNSRYFIGSSLDRLAGIDPASKTVRWTLEDGYGFIDPFLIDGVIVAKSVRPGDVYSVRIISAEDGTVSLEIPAHLRTFCGGNAMIAGHVLKSDIEDHKFISHLSAFDPASGRLLWEADHDFRTDPTTQLGEPSRPVLTEKYVWYIRREVQSDGDECCAVIAVDRATGKTAWRDTFPQWYESLAVNDSYLVIVARGTTYVYAMEDAKAPTPPAGARKKANPKGEKPVKRTRIKPSKDGQYPLEGKGTLSLAPSKKPSKLLWQPSQGKEAALLEFKKGESSPGEIDVHATAGVAVLRVYNAENESDFQIFHDGKLTKIEAAYSDEVWSDFVISPSGKRVAFAVVVSDMTDAHIRIYDVSTGKELDRHSLESDSMLAGGLTWVGDSTILYRDIESDDGDEYTLSV